jgi:hypothetical protein
MKSCGTSGRLIVWAGVLTLLTVPAILQSEVLYLKDDSEIRGTLVSFVGDTLTFEPSFGGLIRVHRSQIVQLVFDESKAAHAPAITGERETPEGPGMIKVVFKDDKLSSKVVVSRANKKREAEIIRANWIEQLLVVGGDTVYSRVDTTMDKTIFQGHDKLYKNTIELEDMSAKLEAGVYQCIVLIRNVGAGVSDVDFDEGPIDVSLELETVGLYFDQTTLVRVGMKKGFLRMGQPKLYRVE